MPSYPIEARPADSLAEETVRTLCQACLAKPDEKCRDTGHWWYQGLNVHVARVDSARINLAFDLGRRAGLREAVNSLLEVAKKLADDQGCMREAVRLYAALHAETLKAGEPLQPGVEDLEDDEPALLLFSLASELQEEAKCELVDKFTARRGAEAFELAEEHKDSVR